MAGVLSVRHGVEVDVYAHADALLGLVAAEKVGPGAMQVAGAEDRDQAIVLVGAPQAVISALRMGQTVQTVSRSEDFVVPLFCEILQPNARYDSRKFLIDHRAKKGVRVFLQDAVVDEKKAAPVDVFSKVVPVLLGEFRPVLFMHENEGVIRHAVEIPD